MDANAARKLLKLLHELYPDERDSEVAMKKFTADCADGEYGEECKAEIERQLRNFVN